MGRPRLSQEGMGDEQKQGTPGRENMKHKRGGRAPVPRNERATSTLTREEADANSLGHRVCPPGLFEVQLLLVHGLLRCAGLLLLDPGVG